MAGICLSVHIQNRESVPEQWHGLFCKHDQWVPWVARKLCIKYFFPSLLGSTTVNFCVCVCVCVFFFYGWIFMGVKKEWRIKRDILMP